MSKGNLYLGICVVLFSGMSSASFVEAQTSQLPSDRIIQQQQQRIEQQRQILQRQRLPQPGTESEETAQTDGINNSDEACLDIHSILLSGAVLLESRQRDRQSLLSPFEDRCLGVSAINNLLRAITNYYTDRGYVTTRAYVTEQDLSSGELRILVIEGKLESAVLESSSEQLDSTAPHASRELYMAFPSWEEGMYLNMRDLEQAIDQLNRLPSNNAQLQLLPGSEPGLSHVVINNNETTRYRFRAGIDNSGQESTGRLQRKLGYQHDNLLGLNDLLAVSLQQDGQRDGDRRKSRSVSVYYEVPYGYWMFDASASYFDYASTVDNFNAVFQTSGVSRNQQLGARRVVHRDGKSVTNFGLSITRKDTRNYLEDVRLESSSRVLIVGRLSLNHTRRVWDGRLSSELAYQRGLGILGGLKDSETDPGSPRAEYSSSSLRLQYQRSFALLGLPTFYSGTLFYQYSDDILFGSEQVSIGGEFTVNGFRDDSVSGSSGGYLRQELSSHLLPAGDYSLGRWLGPLSLSLGLDAGSVKTDFNQGDEQLYSAWIGLRSSGDVSLSVVYAEPFHVPEGVNANHHEVYFSVSMNF